MEFEKFSKIPRFNREIIVTEKIDGTNAQIFIDQFANYEESEWEFINKYNLSEEQYIDKYDCFILAGSKKRFINVDSDNFGFAKWVKDNYKDLFSLGPGKHYGEWWGSGIQRGYDLPKGEKRFSLFNVSKWGLEESRPVCCGVVPVLWKGLFEHLNIYDIMSNLKQHGSYVAPGFMNPEGIVIYHPQGNILLKKTFEKDNKGKDQ